MSEEDFIKRIEPLLNKKEYKTALTIAEKEAKKNPENPYAWYAKGLCLLNLKKFQKALSAFSTFVENERANLVWGFYYLAESHKELKDYSRAIEFYKKSLEKNSKYKKSLFGLEFCYRQTKDFENAIKVNETINNYYPRDYHPWYWLSNLYFLQKDIKKSFLYLLKAIRLKPSDNEVREFHKFLLNEYEKIIESKQGIYALKEIDPGELGYASLNLKDRGINSIEQVEDLQYTRFSLNHLYLTNNQIQQISCLDSFPDLSTLNLDDNQIEEISGLDNLPDLGTLSLEGNKIQVIVGLDNLKSLWSLSLADNEIQKIEGLGNLPKLRFLYLANNHLSEINIANLPVSIEKLNIAGNQITTIQNFGKLVKLSRLDLSYNDLTTIDNLEFLPNLVYLNLKDNPNLPEYFATTYDNPKAIANLRKYNGKPYEELKVISEQELEAIEKQKERETKLKKEKREKDALARKEKAENEAHFGSKFTSNYSSQHNLRKRIEELLRLDDLGNCLYCKNKIPQDVNFAKECDSHIFNLINEINAALPSLAKDKDDYWEKEYRTTETRFHHDLFGNLIQTKVEVTKKKKMYEKTATGRFHFNHFPQIPGTVCKKCRDEYVKATSRYFQRLKRHKYNKKDYVQKIWKSMKKCHEDYMKLLESMIEKKE